MAISFSRPDPSSPAAVGAAQFSVGRRGFEQEEVRDFLRMVSAELARLQERERFLESEMRALQTQGISSPGVLDEETVMRVLGEETARVLTAAREAAHQMRARAAESADRIIREASADAARIRHDAEVEVARQRADAIADAEAEIELAKQQGREMVAEARAYREKVLSELSRRRELAREQIEHLIHHRDRLATAFERARLAATDVVGDLDEFDELADEIEKGAGLLAGSSAPVFVDHTADPEAIPQRGTDRVEEVIDVTVNSTEAVEEIEPTTTEVVTTEAESMDDGVVLPAVTDEPEVQRNTSGMSEHPSTEQSTGHIAEVVQLFGSKKSDKVEVDHLTAPESAERAEVTPPPQEPSVENPQRNRGKKSVDELFAKLRENKIEEVARTIAEPSATKDGAPKASAKNVVVPKLDPALFDHRDEVLAPLRVTMTRAAKRVLADAENAALTKLQAKKFVVSLDTLLPTADEMTQALVESLSEELLNSALAGAQSVAKGLKADLRKRVTKTLVMQVLSPQVTEHIITPLRTQIQRSIEQCNADKDEMSGLTRSAFRELKIQRIDDIVADLACHAYSRGSYLALTPGTSVYWMVDPNGPSCADAEDNSLAGACALGEQFPTGHVHPTCHAGCRCLIAPSGD